LPESYIELKRSIIGNEATQAALRRSWAGLTERLAAVADDVERRQQAVSRLLRLDVKLMFSVFPKSSMMSSSTRLRKPRLAGSENVELLS
jgi:hypothetical protein